MYNVYLIYITTNNVKLIKINFISLNYITFVFSFFFSPIQSNHHSDITIHSSAIYMCIIFHWIKYYYSFSACLIIIEDCCGWWASSICFRTIPHILVLKFTRGEFSPSTFRSSSLSFSFTLHSHHSFLSITFLSSYYMAIPLETWALLDNQLSLSL